jgi:diguanylate cyclase (GGDEF)-like protein
MRILIAEDEPIALRLLSATLSKQGYDVVAARDGRQAWDVLRSEDSPRLAVLDWMMPEMDGLEVCRKTRELCGSDYVYIILLTAKSGKEDVIAGMDAGADDYICKPFDAGELTVRIRAAKRILDLQAQLLATQEALREQAARDPLTRMWNRGAIFEALERELNRAGRSGSPVAVIMCDIDHFKKVNDTYGHAEGDVALCEVAARIGRCARKYDITGRYGGEEFLAVLPQCDESAAAAVAERVRQEVCSRPFDLHGHEVWITLSVGVAATADGGEATCGDLTRLADEALYRAKRDGRNRVALASTAERTTAPAQ